MRYTTLIDITEIPAVYRCQNARLLYLHAVLKCGYHDEDRDVLGCSIRQLAADTGLTVSAVRHALKVLAKYGLIEQRDGVTIVRKYIEAKPISKREAAQKAQKATEAAKERKIEEQRREAKEAEHKAVLANIHAQGKTSLDAYFAMLEQQAAAGDTEAAAILARRKRERASRAAAGPSAIKIGGGGKISTKNFVM